jgi:hypothetical protein
MFLKRLALVLWLGTAVCQAAGPTVTIRSSEELKQALGMAPPGGVIRLAPGDYQGNVSISGRSGAPGNPIVIEGADPKNPPVFKGGTEALHFTSCAHIVIRNIALTGQGDNGINIDDGNTIGSAHHFLLENIAVSDTGPQGNHDCFKFSGLDDFEMRNCTCHGWGGSSIDMVGCHRGLIEGCTFTGKAGCQQYSGPQIKGGSREITVRSCLFDQCSERCVQAGGSTGDPFFRPLDAPYEAADITVEGCTFIGGETPIAITGVEGAVFRYNTVYNPGKYFCRILQEGNRAPSQKGRVERNIFVFRPGIGGVNVGPGTKPETFVFVENAWFAMGNPGASKPSLPTPEQGGVYGIDPRLEAPDKGLFKPLQAGADAYGATALPAPPKKGAAGKKPQKPAPKPRTPAKPAKP